MKPDPASVTLAELYLSHALRDAELAGRFREQAQRYDVETGFEAGETFRARAKECMASAETNARRAIATMVEAHTVFAQAAND